ncbi:hypothetical protein J6590_094409 [Homalodisca vitripennis]|nr:hypothetical protein J6590_094409 [Homalodisca vitripennis]
MQSTTLLFWNASTLQLADRRHVTIGHRYRHLVSLPSRPPPHVTIRHRAMNLRGNHIWKGVWEESYGAPRRTPPPHVTIRHRSVSTREGSVGGVVCHHHMSPSAIALECGRSQGGGLLLSHWSPSRSSRPIRGLGYSGGTSTNINV